MGAELRYVDSYNSRMTRRNALRRLGFTAGAAAVALLGADDLARLVGAEMGKRADDRSLAGRVAREMQQAGVAFAQTYCGVTAVPCIVCYPTSDPPGEASVPSSNGAGGTPNADSDPCPCGSGNTIGCLGCTPPSDCSDCRAVAEYKHCCCKQAATNAAVQSSGLECVTCNGTPQGSPICLGYNLAIAACNTQLDNDLMACG